MGIEKLSVIWPEWKLVEQIGEGSFGKVYKAVREEHGVCTYAAIKVISIPQSDAEVSTLRSEGLDESASKTYFKGIVNDFVNEIKLMESMKGTSNIVSVEDFRVYEKEGRIGYDIFIRMELLTPFNDYVADHAMTEKEVVKLGVDICSALELCARRNIIHRDIKPENIFISSFGDFKVGDFGIAKELEKTTGAMSSKGTLNYMAPEVAAGKKYDSTVDIYSLGLVLYKLLNNNRLPFVDPYAQQIQFQDRKAANDRRLNGVPLPAPVSASPQLTEIILAACAYNPANRFATPTAFKKALQSVSDFDVPAPGAASRENRQADANLTAAARPASRPAPVSNPTMTSRSTTVPRSTTAPRSAPASYPDPAAQTSRSYSGTGYAAPQQVENFNKPKKRKKRMSKWQKAKIILITTVVLVVALAIGLAAFVLTSPAYSVVKSLKEEKYSEALVCYNSDVKTNFIQNLLLKGMLTNGDDRIVEQFKNGEIDYVSATYVLETLEKMGFKGYAKKISELTSIRDADSAIEKGDEYYESGDFENAIKEYSKINESNENYDSIQTKLNELYPKYISSAAEKAKLYNSARNFEQAISYVNTAYALLPKGVDTSELDEMKSESLASYKSDILDQATELINASLFEDALSLIEEAIAVDNNEDFQKTKLTIESSYVEDVTGTVQKHLDKEDYISAARTVSKALTVLPGNSSLKALQTKVTKATPTYLLDVCPPYETSREYKEYVNGETVKIGGTAYTNAFSLQCCSDENYALFNVDANYSILSFTVGHCDGTEMDSTTIKIYCDGVLKTETPIAADAYPQKITVDITGVKQIKVECNGKTNHYYAFGYYGFGNLIVK